MHDALIRLLDMLVNATKDGLETLAGIGYVFDVRMFSLNTSFWVLKAKLTLPADLGIKIMPFEMLTKEIFLRFKSLF